MLGETAADMFKHLAISPSGKKLDHSRSKSGLIPSPTNQSLLTKGSVGQFSSINPNPNPFKYTNKDVLRRVNDDQLNKTSMFDNAPADVDKQAFVLRKRSPSKEIQPTRLKLKSITAIEKMEDFYDRDNSQIDKEFFPSKLKFLGISSPNSNSQVSIFGGRKKSMPAG